MLRKVDRAGARGDMPSNIVIDKVIAEEQARSAWILRFHFVLQAPEDAGGKGQGDRRPGEGGPREREAMQDTFDRMEKDQNQLEDSFEAVRVRSGNDQVQGDVHPGEGAGTGADVGEVRQRHTGDHVAGGEAQILPHNRRRRPETGRHPKEVRDAVENEKIKLKRALETEFEEKLIEKDRLATELKVVKEQLGEASRKIMELQKLVKVEVVPFTSGAGWRQRRPGPVQTSRPR